MVQVIQIGMNSSDLAGSLRFHEALGFLNAGGQGLWGEAIRTQGLEADGRAIMWWMVGPQPFFQLEFFHHTNPAQRPLPADWNPADRGWTRCGYVVDDLDAITDALFAMGITALAPPSGAPGERRVAFREPYVGVVVELMERAAAPPWCHPTSPALVYAATSVSDLEGAHKYYSEIVAPGAVTIRLESLHSAEHEELWGLGGRVRAGTVFLLDEVAVEIVAYRDLGRPRPADYRSSDQGVVNVALGSRSVPEIRSTFARLAAAGLVPPSLVDIPHFCGGYIVEPERELEIVAVEREMDELLGFRPANPFLSTP